MTSFVGATSLNIKSEKEAFETTSKLTTSTIDYEIIKWGDEHDAAHWDQQRSPDYEHTWDLSPGRGEGRLVYYLSTECCKNHQITNFKAGVEYKSSGRDDGPQIQMKYDESPNLGVRSGFGWEYWTPPANPSTYFEAPTLIIYAEEDEILFIKGDYEHIRRVSLSWTLHNTVPDTPDTPEYNGGELKAGKTYQFWAHINDPENDIVSCRFDWGDGSTSDWSYWEISDTDIVTTKSFDSAGTYEVKVQARDYHDLKTGEERSAWSSTLTVTVRGLTADAGGPYSGRPNTAIQFDGSADYGTSPYSYKWDFDDGSTSTQQNPTHTYSSKGDYTTTLTVTDDDGYTDTDTASVSIQVSKNSISLERMINRILNSFSLFFVNFLFIKFVLLGTFI